MKTGSCRSAGDLLPVELGIEADPSFKFSGPLGLDVRISTTDGFIFYASGTLSYLASGECRRCLKEKETPVTSNLRGVYALPEAIRKLAPHDGQSSSDIYPLDPAEQSIDLGDLVRESLVLEYPK